MKKYHIIFFLLLFIVTAQAQNQMDIIELNGYFNEIDFTVPNVTYTYFNEGDLYVSEVMHLPERTQSNTLDKILIFADPHYTHYMNILSEDMLTTSTMFMGAK